MPCKKRGREGTKNARVEVRMGNKRNRGASSVVRARKREEVAEGRPTASREEQLVLVMKAGPQLHWRGQQTSPKNGGDRRAGAGAT